MTTPSAHVVLQSQSVSYSEVASIAILTWDIFINLGDEVELIWKKSWTSVKVMYLFTRYLPWAFQLALLAINVDVSTGLQYSVAQCQHWMAVEAVMLQLIITSVDIILILRVFVLYSRSQRLLIAMMIAFSAELAVLSYVLARTTPRLAFDDKCFVIHSPPIFIAYWITSLAFETLLFVLSIYKFVGAVRQGWGRRPVMREFITDGTWAYTLIFITMFVNSMLYKLVKNSPLAGVCFTWLMSVLSFAGSRIILNPRRRGAPSVGQDTSVELVSMSPLSPVYLRGSSVAHSPLSDHADSPATYKAHFEALGTSN